MPAVRKVRVPISASAAQALDNFGYQKGTDEALLKALGDTHSKVRDAVAGALRHFGKDQKTIKALVRLLSDPNPDVRQGASAALRNIDNEGRKKM